MTGIDWSVLSRLVPELVIMIIFAAFVERMNRRQDTAQEKRDGLWREFLQKQSEQTVAAISRIAEEVKENGKETAKLKTALETHDSHTMQFIARQDARAERPKRARRHGSGG